MQLGNMWGRHGIHSIMCGGHHKVDATFIFNTIFASDEYTLWHISESIVRRLSLGLKISFGACLDMRIDMNFNLNELEVI